MNKIKAVAFDLDGTLYPNNHMLRRSIPVVLRHLRFFRAFSRIRKEIRNYTEISDLYTLQNRLLMEYLNLKDTETAHQMTQKIIFEKWEKVFRHVKAYPGVRETVEKLREQGLKTAVLSDFPIERKLKMLNLEGLWDVSMCSEETHYLKPHNIPFKTLSERLNLSPEEILYVGNHFIYDVVGADNAGLKTAIIMPPRKARKTPLNKIVKADIVFSDYNNLLKEINDRFYREG